MSKRAREREKEVPFDGGRQRRFRRQAIVVLVLVCSSFSAFRAATEQRQAGTSRALTWGASPPCQTSWRREGVERRWREGKKIEREVRKKMEASAGATSELGKNHRREPRASVSSALLVVSRRASPFSLSSLLLAPERRYRSFLSLSLNGKTGRLGACVMKLRSVSVG